MRIQTAFLVLLTSLATVCFVSAGQEKSLSDGRLQEGAARVERTMAKIHQDFVSGKTAPATHVMTEPDLNAFLELEVSKYPQTGVEQFSVRLQPENTFTTRLMVDLDKVQVKLNSVFETLFESLLGGKQVLEVEGILKTENGEGTYEVINARLNDIPLPAVIVESVLRSVGARLEPPFDPTEPFELQEGIRKIEILKSKARIFTGNP